MADSDEEIASFYDSDQFDEDSLSLCSWFSEHDSISDVTWKGWKRSSNVHTGHSNYDGNSIKNIMTLVDLSAKVVAEYFPFQAVDEHHPPVPEQIQLKVAYWSFPQKEDNIQLYSCIAHGTLDEFHLAELILKWNNVKNVIQIGFHLTGLVINSKLEKEEQSITVTFDRCQVITCSCSCQASSKWCSHVIALCLFRIRHPDLVSFRAPLSESLSRLKRDQLQKFIQYLINELPPKVLPTAQGLLDQLLNDPASKINTFSGAPDPTAGAGYIDEPTWSLDGETLRENIRKMIAKFCGPSPVAFIDLNPSFFTSSAPTISDEWLNLLRPLVSHEPEGIWNLFDIIKNLFKARDVNSVEILKIITEELLNFPQLSLWWFVASTEADGNCIVGSLTNMQQSHPNANANLNSAGYARNTVAKLFDELVELWKITMILPCIGITNKERIKVKLLSWHDMVLEKAIRGFNGREQKLSDAVENFKGFKTAVEAGGKEWKSFLNDFGVDLDLVVNLNECIHDIGPLLTATLSHEWKIEDQVEDLFSCVNAFHTLGFSNVARSLAIILTDKLLAQLVIDQNHLSVVVKSAYICKVMRETADDQRRAFQLGILGLALPRKPASTKLQEIKLAHCEMNLRSALKVMMIGHDELDIIKASIHNVTNLCNTKEPQSKPFIFVIYVFEVLSGATVQSKTLMKLKNKFSENCTPSSHDKQLAYRFALQSLGWICFVSDQNHSMLCECFRHFRNDLAQTLLWHCRSSNSELKEILSVLLELEIYIPGLLCFKKSRKASICGKTYLLDKITREPLPVPHRLNAAPSEFDDKKSLAIKEDGLSQQNAFLATSEEDWDAEIVSTNAVCERKDKDSNNQPVNVMNSDNDSSSDSAMGNEVSMIVNAESCITSEIACHVEGDSVKHFENDKCLLKDGFAHFDSKPGGSEETRKNLAFSSAVYECDPATDINKERETESGATSTDRIVQIRENKTIFINDLETKIEKCNDEPESSDNRKENFISSESIDGRNTWDPAISWAERCEAKNASIMYRNDDFEELYEEANSALFPIEIRRNVDRIRLECESHALFELAKEVLSKSLDSMDEKNPNIVPRPHKQLQLAAFEIAIFSLRLHNFISPKWLSRTYSSHVSWISDKCIDIGCTALQKLNDNWEDVLTPPEVIDISGRASRSGDHKLRRAAAELAVSCLPQSHTLNPGEIQQAVNMCKEEDIEMLERACACVEASSKNGGIQPDILFYVARQWQYIHEKLTEEKNRQAKPNTTPNVGRNFLHKGNLNKIKKDAISSTSRSASFRMNDGGHSKAKSASKLTNAIGCADLKLRPMQCIPHQLNDERFRLNHNNTTSSYQDFGQATILTAEQYVQQQMHRMAEEMLKRSCSHEHVSSKVKSSSDSASYSWIYPQYSSPLHHTMPVVKCMNMAKQNMDDYKSVRSNPIGENSEASLQLQAAFRIGMKALEVLARRGIEERSDVKYAQSPPCSDDIRWLCALAASLGPSCLRKFCKTVISSVSSPYVLHDLALEAARHFAMYNPAQLASYLRSPAVSPIVTKCLTMYSELVRRDLVLLTQVGYSDFVELLRRARSAFCMAPGGMTKFNELLEMIRKSCPKKGDLWQHIMSGLSRA